MRSALALPAFWLVKQSSQYKLWFKTASSHVFILVLCAAIPDNRLALTCMRANFAIIVACDVLVFLSFVCIRLCNNELWSWFACSLLTGGPVSKWMISLGKAGFPITAEGTLLFPIPPLFTFSTVGFCYEQGPCEDAFVAYFARK